jgi:hypothetical protein
MTLDRLITLAALECVDERERHLAIYTVGLNGYVCRNDAQGDESHALFKGIYRDCQVWIERRGIAAAIKFVIAHMHEVPELNARELSHKEILALLARIPDQSC